MTSPDDEHGNDSPSVIKRLLRVGLRRAEQAHDDAQRYHNLRHYVAKIFEGPNLPNEKDPPPGYTLKQKAEHMWRIESWDGNFWAQGERHKCVAAAWERVRAVLPPWVLVEGTRVPAVNVEPERAKELLSAIAETADCGLHGGVTPDDGLVGVASLLIRAGLVDVKEQT